MVTQRHQSGGGRPVSRSTRRNSGAGPFRATAAEDPPRGRSGFSEEPGKQITGEAVSSGKPINLSEPEVSSGKPINLSEPEVSSGKPINEYSVLKAIIFIIIYNLIKINHYLVVNITK